METHIKCAAQKMEGKLFACPPCVYDSVDSSFCVGRAESLCSSVATTVSPRDLAGFANLRGLDSGYSLSSNGSALAPSSLCSCGAMIWPTWWPLHTTAKLTRLTLENAMYELKPAVEPSFENCSCGVSGILMFHPNPAALFWLKPIACLCCIICNTELNFVSPSAMFATTYIVKS